MAERLPVVYVAIAGDGRVVDARAEAPVSTEFIGGGRVVEYIPRAQANEARRVTCGDCQFWKLTRKWEFDEERDRTGIVERNRCTCEDGLRKPKRDGSSSCSYGEPRKARGDG